MAKSHTACRANFIRGNQDNRNGKNRDPGSAQQVQAKALVKRVIWGAVIVLKQTVRRFVVREPLVHGIPFQYGLSPESDIGDQGRRR